MTFRFGSCFQFREAAGRHVAHRVEFACLQLEITRALSSGTTEIDDLVQIGKPLVPVVSFFE